MIDDSVYNNHRTEARYLKAISDLHLDGYKLLRSKEYFFIWQRYEGKKPKSEYIRLCLMRDNSSDPTFYWSLDLSFKPFRHLHNGKAENNQRGPKFKAHEENVAFEYFSNFLNIINNYVGATK